MTNQPATPDLIEAADSQSTEGLDDTQVESSADADDSGEELEVDAGSNGAGSGDGTGDTVLDAEGNFSLPLYVERAYLDYAISVVKSRALPDCRDGQKPVQRRFLYAMRDMGLTHTSKPIKSARVVGDVMGKYHPHGDSSIYDAMVRTAQSFTLRYPLIDGQGNFGSRDGDGAAAMRYTECRLTAIAELLLSEIDRGTVDFKPNYDGAFSEPVVLPARLPMLLLNGASGVAVGYAVEIPSHNLREVSAAAMLLIDKPEASDDDLFATLGAPDFPGGGQIISPASLIREAYLTGKGGVRMRARWRREELARGQWRIVVYELPHGVSTAHILEDIEVATNPQPKAGKKEISQEAKNIKQLMMSVLDTARDESFKDEPVRLVLEPKTLKITEDELMSALLARTRLEHGVPINLVSIAGDGNPRSMSLRMMLSQWIAFRFETVERRIRHRLEQALRRLHILEGRMVAFLKIDEVIRIIRESEDPKLALMEKIGLTDVQAEDILEIRLRQLATLEGIKIEREADELRTEAAGLQHLLDDRKAFTRCLVKEIEADAKKYGDERRTLVEVVQPIRAADVIVADEPTTVLISAGGWLRARQGHAIDRASVAWKQGDTELAILETRTTWPLILLDDKGRAYSIAVSEVPGGRGDGVPWTSLVDIQDGAKIVHVFSNDPGASYLFTNSRSYGFITQVLELVGTRKSGKAFMTLDFNEKILPPVPVTDMTHTVAACSYGPKESRLVLFPVSEMKVMAKGLGVIVMVIENDEELVAVDLLATGTPTAIKVTADKLVVPIKGEDLNKFRTRRARKGCQLSKKIKPLSVALA